MFIERTGGALQDAVDRLNNTRSWKTENLFVSLLQKLSGQRHPAHLTIQCNCVWKPYFDSFQNVAASSGHLSSGLIKMFLTLCFSCLSSDDQQSTLEDVVSDAVKRNRFSNAGSSLDWKKWVSTIERLVGKCLHGFQSFCSHHQFRKNSSKERRPVFPFPKKIQKVVKKYIFSLGTNHRSSTSLIHRYTQCRSGLYPCRKLLCANIGQCQKRPGCSKPAPSSGSISVNYLTLLLSSCKRMAWNESQRKRLFGCCGNESVRGSLRRLSMLWNLCTGGSD